MSELPPLPLSKRTRVILEGIRTFAAVVSSLGTLAVLAHVYGLI